MDNSHQLLNVINLVQGVAAIFRNYGRAINDVKLAEIVVFLYKSARASSTRKSYTVGQRHWAHFQLAHPKIPFFPFQSHSANQVTLALCFFAAHLASRPRIRRHTTVRSYVCHVKALWRDAGCAEEHLDSALLRAVMRGIRRALPSPPDPREAFVLPNYKLPSYYLDPPSDRLLIFKAATVLGFHAMLRFGAFCQFNAQSLSLVLTNGLEVPLSSTPIQNFTTLRRSLVGIIFKFSPKYTSAHSRGVAYFCHICVIAPSLKSHCPVCVIVKLWRRGHFRAPFRPVFNPIFFSPPTLTAYLGYIAGKPGPHPQNPFKSHSLRIGGHTFYTVHGMNPDLRDYLARRAIPRCSLRYYRASPAANLYALRSFYKSISPSTLIPPSPNPPAQ